LFDAFDVKVLRIADGALLRRLAMDNEYILGGQLALFNDNEQWWLCPIELWLRAVAR